MASKKLTALTAAVTLTAASLLYGVSDPSGTPVSEKITVAVLEQSLTLANQIGYSLVGLKAGKLDQFAATSSAELATVLSNETGTGVVVYGTSPTIGSPVINVGSDATGDIYYRSAGGAFTRLGVGSNGQMLGLVGGLPAWANDGLAWGSTASGTTADGLTLAAGANTASNAAGLRITADNTQTGGNNPALVSLNVGQSGEMAGITIEGTGKNSSTFGEGLFQILARPPSGGAESTSRNYYAFAIYNASDVGSPNLRTYFDTGGRLYATSPNNVAAISASANSSVNGNAIFGYSTVTTADDGLAGLAAGNGDISNNVNPALIVHGGGTNSSTGKSLSSSFSSSTNPTGRTYPLASFRRGQTKTGTTGSTSDAFDLAYFYREQATTGSGAGTYSAAGSVVYAANNSSQTGTVALTDTVDLYKGVQDVDSTGDLIDLALGANAMFTVTKNGKVVQDGTITAGGTTGNQTIDQPVGCVNVAAAGTTITVTNALVNTNSIIFATKMTNDSTCLVRSVVAGSGSFVIALTGACAAETKFCFEVKEAQ